MDLPTFIRRSAGCSIDQGPAHIRATVGAGLADEVQECYRAFVNECLQRQCKRANLGPQGCFPSGQDSPALIAAEYLYCAIGGD